MPRQLTFDYELDQLCNNCMERQISTKNLCGRCYQQKRQEVKHPKDLSNSIPRKTDKATPRQYIPKPPHTVEWYRKRYIEKHGPEIITDLRAVKTKQYWTLTEVGIKYGFSREYARQLFKTIFGKSSNGYQKAKKVARETEIKSMNCANDPRHKVAETSKKGANSELIVFNKCKELGFDVKIPCGQVYDLEINGFNVDIKSAGRTVKLVPKNKKATASEYFYFNTRPIQHAKCDLYICHVIPNDVFYIIPTNAMGKHGCYIRANRVRYRTNYIPKRLDYEQYRDAWSLLSGREIPNPIYKEAVRI